MNQRHHSAHPPSAVKANPAVNKQSNPSPVEQAARPNVNPSLPGPVGVDPANARAPRVKAPEAEAVEPDDCVDPDDPDCDDRKKVSPSFAY